MAEQVTELTVLGFEPVTRCTLQGDRIKPESLDWEDSSGWIYAYASQGCVRYIGITTMVLRSRLDGYSYQLGDRVQRLIQDCLLKEHAVEVYGARRPGVEKEALEVEESKLLRQFRPDWNVRE